MNGDAYRPLSFFSFSVFIYVGLICMCMLMPICTCVGSYVREYVCLCVHASEGQSLISGIILNCFFHFILRSMVSQSNLEPLIMPSSQFALWMELQVGFHAHLIFMRILGSQNLHTCLANALIIEQPCHTQSLSSYKDSYHTECRFYLQVPSLHWALQLYIL